MHETLDGTTAHLYHDVSMRSGRRTQRWIIGPSPSTKAGTGWAFVESGENRPGQVHTTWISWDGYGWHGCRFLRFVEPGDDVYEGMVVGENSRENDLDVNPARAKAFSNVRESNKEATVVMKAPRKMTLEMALEYIAVDEAVEITPNAIRMRKLVLKEVDRKRAQRSQRQQTANAAR